MKILADENCDRVLVEALRTAKHDVVTVAELDPSISDDEVFALAMQHSRILLTHDHDFGLIAERASDHPPAIALMRLDPLSPGEVARTVVQALSDLGESLIGRYAVIEPKRIWDRALKKGEV